MRRIENLPVRRTEEPEVIEPEIVGFEPPVPFWKRLLARAALGVVMGAAGVALMAVGAALTLTILGAFIGIPLIILGLMLVAGALFMPMLRGRIKVVSFRWPPR